MKKLTQKIYSAYKTLYKMTCTSCYRELHKEKNVFMCKEPSCKMYLVELRKEDLWQT